MSVGTDIPPRPSGSEDLPPRPQSGSLPMDLLQKAAWEPTAEDIAEHPGRYVTPQGGFTGALYSGALATSNFVGSLADAAVVHPVVGLANLFGAGIQKSDTRALVSSALRKATGLASGQSWDELYRAELQKQQSATEQMGMLGHAANSVAGMAGWVTGTFNPIGLSGKAFSGLNAVNSAIVRSVLSKQAPTWITKAAELAGRATAFGELQAVTEGAKPGVDAQGQPTGKPAEGWQRAEAGLMAAATWPLYEAAGTLARGAANAWMKRAVQGDESAVAPLTKWLQAGLENGKIARMDGEGADQFLARQTNDWIKLGMPGAGRLTTKRLVGAAIETGIEGLGMSALDAEWRKDGIDAVLRGDTQAALKFAERTLTNMIGVGILKTGGIENIYPWQRSQPTPEDVPLPQHDRAGAPPLPPGSDLGRPPEKKPVEPTVGANGPAEPGGRGAFAAEQARQQRERPEQPERPVEATVGESGPLEAPMMSGRLQRLGWTPNEDGIEIKDSPYSVKIEKGMATLSPRLADALGVKEPLRWDEAQKVLEQASLINGLAAKQALPGKQITTDGIHGEARVQEGKDGRLLAFRFGDVYESPMGPDQKWSRTELKPETPTPVPPEQKQVADSLADFRLSRSDLSPASEAILDKVIQVLGGVPADKDPAVAETLNVLRSGALNQHLQSNPEAAIEDVAHMLTDMSPQVVLGERAAEMQAAAAEAQKRPQEKTQAEFTEGMKPGSIERARAVKVHRQAVIEAAQAGETLRPEVVADYPEARPSEAMGTLVPPQVARAVETGAGGIKDIVAKALEYDIAPLARRIRNRGEPELATRVDQATTNAKANRARMASDWDAFAKGLSRPVVKELLRPIGNGDSSWTVFHAAMDSEAGKALGFDKAELSPEAQKAIDRAHDLFLESGRVMQDAGARVKNIEGQPEFSVDENRWRMVRRFTGAMRDALYLKSGPLYQKFIEEVSRLNGLKVNEAEKETNALIDRGVIRRDAAEFQRYFRLMPDTLAVNGKPQTILEADPYDQVKSMIDHAALRAGFGKEFGWDAGTGDDGRPVPSLDLVNQANPRARDDVMAAFRALNGMPVRDPLKFLEPGTRAYSLWEAASGLMQIWKAGKLTHAFLMRPSELFGGAGTFLGARNVAQSGWDWAKSVANGSFGDTLQRLMDKGIIVGDAQKWYAEGQGAEKFSDMARLVGQTLTTPLHLVHHYLLPISALSLERAAEDMKQGEGTLANLGMLKGMGFDDARARAIIQGHGTPEEYDRFLKNGINYLSGGSTGLGVERSMGEHGPIWRNLFLFSGYFRRRMTQMAGIKDAFAEALDQRDAKKGGEALGMALRYAAYGTLSGVIGQTLVSLWKDGLDGPAQMMRESLTNPGETAWTVLITSLFGGLGGAVLEAAKRTDEKQGGLSQIPATMLSSLGPVTAAQELTDFVKGMLPQGEGFLEHDSNNPYAGMSTVEKVSAFAQKMMPFAHDVDRGLFGLNTLALGVDDVKRDNALSAYFRWRRANVPTGSGDPDQNEQQTAFRSAMKEATRHIRDGEMDEARDAIRQAAQAKNWRSVKQSLLSKRIFDNDWTSLTPAQKQSMMDAMGPENLGILHAYDHTLERLADWADR